MMHNSQRKMTNGKSSSFSMQHRHLQHREDKNILGMRGGVMKKVRSLDSVRLNGYEFKGGWSQPSTRGSSRPFQKRIQDDKASKFSSCSVGKARYVLFYFTIRYCN